MHAQITAEMGADKSWWLKSDHSLKDRTIFDRIEIIARRNINTMKAAMQIV